MVQISFRSLQPKTCFPVKVVGIFLSGESMAEGGDAPQHIQLKVKDQQGSEVQFKIKKTTPLRKLPGNPRDSGTKWSKLGWSFELMSNSYSNYFKFTCFFGFLLLFWSFECWFPQRPFGSAHPTRTQNWPFLDAMSERRGLWRGETCFFFFKVG